MQSENNEVFSTVKVKLTVSEYGIQIRYQQDLQEQHQPDRQCFAAGWVRGHGPPRCAVSTRLFLLFIE